MKFLILLFLFPAWLSSAAAPAADDERVAAAPVERERALSVGESMPRKGALVIFRYRVGGGCSREFDGIFLKARPLPEDRESIFGIPMHHLVEPVCFPEMGTAGLLRRFFGDVVVHGRRLLEGGWSWGLSDSDISRMERGGGGLSASFSAMHGSLSQVMRGVYRIVNAQRALCLATDEAAKEEYRLELAASRDAMEGHADAFFAARRTFLRDARAFKGGVVGVSAVSERAPTACSPVIEACNRLLIFVQSSLNFDFKGFRITFRPQYGGYGVLMLGATTVNVWGPEVCRRHPALREF